MVFDVLVLWSLMSNKDIVIKGREIMQQLSHYYVERKTIHQSHLPLLVDLRLALRVVATYYRSPISLQNSPTVSC